MTDGAVNHSPGMNGREGVVRPTNEELLGVLNAARIALKSRDQSPFEARVLDGLKVAIAALEEAAPAQSAWQPEPVMWACLVPNPLGELRIRAWTADRKRMESLRGEGLDMQALYALPSSDRGGVG